MVPTKFIGGLIFVFLFSSVLAGEFDITPENIEAFQPIADHLKISVEKILLAHQKFYGNLTKRADQFNPSPTPSICTAEAASCEDGNTCTALGTCSKDDVTQLLYCYGYNVNNGPANSATNAKGKVCGYTDGDLCQPIKCKVDETCSDHTVISCSDSDLCTTNERCVSGVCLKDTVSCDDSNACTTDTCNSATGCSNTAISCDDSNACTTDTCNALTGCANTAISCDDSNACTTDTCDALTGCANTAISCDDSDVCTTDTCDALTGCANTAISCDDSNACTTDTCDAITGCANTAISCDDSNACTTDTCDALTGCANTAISCDDTDACTTDTCDALTGCANTAISCDDSDVCTTDTCDALTGCANTAISCDDSDACTTDTCDAITGCANTAISCDDSDACTTDTCDALTGCANTAISCDDSDVCTTDTCDALTGCANTAISCDDSNACTTDTCNALTGCANTAISCDDSNACTTDSCNVLTGCVNTAVSCDDSNACTTDTCNVLTGCAYTTISCDDSNSCTTDSCNPASGCSNAPKTSFYCDNGTPVPLDNRCEVTPSETVGENLCNGHPCVKDDNPNLTAGHNKGFCDCYSGWSGQQCDVKEFGSGDTLPPVDSVNGNFKPAVPTLDPQDEYQGRPALALTITIPSSQSPLHNPNVLGSFEKLTRLIFQNPTESTDSKRTGDLYIPATSKRAVNDNPNACNYPNNPRWALDTENDAQQGWIDSYSNSFDYAELATCGLSFVNQDGNFAYFNTSLRIERDYTLGNQRFSFDRTFFVDQVITIEFPRHLSVSTNVVVSNNTVEFYAAVTEIHFNPVHQVWDITVSTAINKPFYKLELAAPASNPHPPSPIRDWIFVSDDIVSCPNDYSGDCKQTWKYQTHSCDALNIAALTLDFNVICISGTTPNSLPGECATPNPEQVEAIIEIKTASACPRSGEYKITGSSMSSYDDNTYTNTKGLFGISENMYLGVDFNAPPAGISSIKIISLCAYPRINNPSNVPSSCPDERKVDLNDVHSETATNYGTHKFAFYTQAGHLKAASGVAENQNKITVQAELEITYDGTLSKRTAGNSRHYTLSTDLLIKGDAAKFEQEIVFEKSSASTTTFGLLVLVLVIAFLF